MQKKPSNLKRRLSLFLMLAVLVSSMLPIGGAAHTGDADAVLPVNLAVYARAGAGFAGDRASLLDAIEDGDAAVIYITDDFLIDGAAVSIPPGRDITIASAAGERFAIYQRTAGQRHFDVSGTLRLQNITLSGAGTDGSQPAADRGGVSVISGRLYMGSGAVITHNRADRGGGVSVYADSRFTMSEGAVIDGNSAIGTSANIDAGGGGGVFVEGPAIFEMTGGRISRNVSNIPFGMGGGGGVHLSSLGGQPAMFSMSGGVIGGASPDYANIITSPTGFGAGVFIGGSSSFNMYGNASIAHNWIGAGNNSSGGGVVLQPGGAFAMNDDARIAFNSAGNQGGGLHMTGGVFTMNSGYIENNRVNTSGAGGGGVHLGGGIVHMNGGVIRNHTQSRLDSSIRFNNGGGVRVSGGVFNMNGGRIYGNDVGSIAGTAGNGGGVLMTGGTFNMNDGQIHSNNAEQDGGGVNVTGGTFNIMGGSIHGNRAHGRETSLGGGGVAVGPGNFNLDDSAEPGTAIADNHAGTPGGPGRFGGGLLVRGGTATINSGIISGNTAGYGGGIFVQNGAPLSVSGNSRITGNAAANNGGGIAAMHYNDIQISPGTIFAGNTASTAHDLMRHPDYPNIASNLPAGYCGIPGGLGGNASSVGWSGVSIPSTHPLNNFDINFTGRQLATYTVVFHGNGGTVLPENERRTVLEGTSIEDASTMPPNPTNPRFDFEGWTIGRGSERVWFLPTTQVTTDMVDQNGELHVFARWWREPRSPQGSSLPRTHRPPQTSPPPVSAPPPVDTNNPSTGR